MKLKFLHLIITVSLLRLSASAQEVIFPLNDNQQLINESKKISSFQRHATYVDTVTLPFYDDFSHPGMYPYDSLWLDSGVYINNNYCEVPFTIGVATFDGLNQYGHPYQPTATSDSIADYLTSRPIDLDVTPGDTSVWLYFFYQPQGLGDEPESGDSLVLQFKDTGNVWNNVWAVDGRPDTAFQRVNIRITDEKYLFKGFQLRFYNIATVNGNRDQWNLDYLYLNNGIVENDSIRDFSMVGPVTSLLSEYNAMPYTHYKPPGPGASAMNTEVKDSIFVINYGPTTLNPHLEVLETGNPIPIFSANAPPLTGNPMTYVPYTYSLNSFSYPFNSADSADFVVKSYVEDPVADLNKFNDTSYYYQHFHNYYAYDDGSAEVSYGITGNLDVWMAYKFNVKIQDTLRGMQIYFNPTGVDVSNKLFQLTVWSDVNVGTNTSTILYRMINQKPDTFGGINGYKTYLFDTTLVVGPGNIWVGIIQNEPQTLYGVGLDKNLDSHSKMFYHIDNNWFQSSIHGSWMIRPLFGKKISLVSVDEMRNDEQSFSIYPNPTSGTFRLEFENKMNINFKYQIFDCIGSLIREERISAPGDIDISNFSKGVYIVRLLDEKDHSLTSVRKLIVN